MPARCGCAKESKGTNELMETPKIIIDIRKLVLRSTLQFLFLIPLVCRVLETTVCQCTKLTITNYN